MKNVNEFVYRESFTYDSLWGTEPKYYRTGFLWKNKKYREYQEFSMKEHCETCGHKIVMRVYKFDEKFDSKTGKKNKPEAVEFDILCPNGDSLGRRYPGTPQ